MPRAVAKDQLALDETLVEIPSLEDALEKRQARKAVLGEAQKAYDEAHELAAAEVAKLELPDGKAVRAGRFRISRNAVSARSVSFETKASSRVRITLLEPGEAEAEELDDVAGDAPPRRLDPDGMADLASHARRAREGGQPAPSVTA